MVQISGGPRTIMSSPFLWRPCLRRGSAFTSRRCSIDVSEHRYSRHQRPTSSSRQNLMRRLVAVNLIIALLAPWMAVATGATVRAPPCPMHRAGVLDRAKTADAAASGHSGHAKHETSSHHTTARGCNCAGECGRIGAAFTLVAEADDVGPAPTAGVTQVTITTAPASTVDRLLPFPTGPPRRLRS